MGVWGGGPWAARLGEAAQLKQTAFKLVEFNSFPVKPGPCLALKVVVRHSLIELFGIPQATLQERRQSWADAVGFELATNGLHSL